MTQRITTTDEVLNHYRQQTPYSTAGALALLYEDLPDHVPSLCAVLQGKILHMFWIGEKTYGITHEQLKASGRTICIEFSYELAEERLRNIVELDDRPLGEPREPGSRSVGCCRDYAVMLTSILRRKGVPARVRTGVALYFVAPEGRLIEDHYVTEHWDAAEHRWQLTDPQIDDVQRPAIEKDLNTPTCRTASSLPDGSRSRRCGPGGSLRPSASHRATPASPTGRTSCSPTSSGSRGTSSRSTDGGESAIRSPVTTS